MSFLKSIAGHFPCDTRIQTYLEYRAGEKRAIAKDFVNLYSPREMTMWAKTMDESRKLAGLDEDRKNLRSVRYQHFIISPNPRDACDIDSLRDLTMTWVKEFFGDGEQAGMLGMYEVAVIYHDDNANGIPHAHVIVNNYNMETGKKMHISNRVSRELMPDRLQELAEERGLSYFDNTKANRKHESLVTRGSFLTKAERAFRREGKYSWKQEIRDAVNVAKRLSPNSEDGFVHAMSELGFTASKINKIELSSAVKVEAENIKTLIGNLKSCTGLKVSIDGKRCGLTHISKLSGDVSDVRIEFKTPDEDVPRVLNLADTAGLKADGIRTDWLYSFKTNPNRSAYGFRLGKNYCYEKVSKDLVAAGMYSIPQTDKTQMLTNIKKYLARLEYVADIQEGLGLREAAVTLSFNAKNNIRCFKDYEQVIRMYEQQSARHKSSDGDKAKKALLDARYAMSVAKHGNFFVGISDKTDENPTVKASRLAEKARVVPKRKRSSSTLTGRDRPHFGHGSKVHTPNDSRRRSSGGGNSQTKDVSR